MSYRDIDIISSSESDYSAPQPALPHHQHPHNALLRPLPHSAADLGFFQKSPKLGNQFGTDIAFQRILQLYIPSEIAPDLFHELTILAENVLSPQVLHFLEDAERHPPELSTHDAFGQRSERLRTSEGWKKLLELGAKEGCVAEGYEGQLGRMGQFARYYLFSPSSALVTCPFAMTDGAARLLSRHLAPIQVQPASANFDFGTPTYNPLDMEAETSRRVFKRAYNRLTSRFPNVRWTSGQWMTERTGGSDVSRTETIATYQPFSGPMADKPENEQGPWVVNGYKFFSSATDADMTILLARTPGSKKLSAFYAPMRNATGERNGARIVRLKKKLGTRPLATAEVELKGMRAWLIGREGEGLQQISTILNITRVHNSVSAVSFMRRALSVAKAYSKVRVVSKDRLLRQTPLHLRTLAQMELLTRASAHLAFLTVHLLALSESPSTTMPATVEIPSGSAHKLLRLLTPLTKAITAKLSISVISECVEALGGVGYIENEEPLNVARLLRDAQVLSIWEGTTNVLINDLVSSLKRPSQSGREDRVYKVIGDFLQENLGHTGTAQGDAADVLEQCKLAVWREWESLEQEIDMGSREDLTLIGRKLLWRLAWIIVGCLLIVDARQDAQGAAVEAARRWVVERSGLVEGRIGKGAKDEGGWDEALVFGEEQPVRKDDPQHKL